MRLPMGPSPLTERCCKIWVARPPTQRSIGKRTMKIIIKKSEAKEPFTFAFMDDSGKTLVRSENYAARTNCVKGVESVRKNSQIDSRYELTESKNGKLYFNLKASNGQIVATSALYAAAAERSAAIKLLKNNALTMPMEEQE